MHWKKTGIFSECVQAVNDACEQLQLQQTICQKFK